MNISGVEVVNDASLSQFNNNTYAFNFSQPPGDYLVRLCDNTFREVSVEPDDSQKMILLIAVLVPFLLGAGLLWVQNGLNEQLWGAKSSLILAALWFFLGGMLALLLSIQEYLGVGVIHSFMTIIYQSYLYILLLISMLYFVWLLYFMIKKVIPKKETVDYGKV